jgi:hypothetical protein
MVLEEILRDLDMDPARRRSCRRHPPPRCQTAFSAAIAAATTCRRGSPSSEAIEPDAAGVMLVGRIVEARGREMRGVAAVVGDIVGHGA